MPRKYSEIDNKKSNARSFKSKKNALTNSAIGKVNQGDHYQIMTTGAYARQLSFKSNDADTLRDRLEVDVEIEEDNAQDINGIDYQFLTNKSQQMN